MVAKGIIIATSRSEAHNLRVLAFDRFWVDTSPRSLQQGALRGVEANPVLMVYGAVSWRDLMTYLRPAFRGREPEVFHIRRLGQ